MLQVARWAVSADQRSLEREQISGGHRVIELDEYRHPKGAPDDIAMGAAGEDRLAVRAVMRLIDRLGFDAVDAGPLANDLALEPDGSRLAVTHDSDELRELVAQRQEQPSVDDPSVGVSEWSSPDSNRP